MICVRLNNNGAEPVECKSPIRMYTLVGQGDLVEVHLKPKLATVSKPSLSFQGRCLGIERRALNGRRAHNLHEPHNRIRFFGPFSAAEALKGSAFVELARVKTSPRSDVQPDKKSRRVGSWWRCLEAKRLVIREIEPVELQIHCEGPSIITGTRLAIIVHNPATPKDRYRLKSKTSSGRRLSSISAGNRNYPSTQEV